MYLESGEPPELAPYFLMYGPNFPARPMSCATEARPDLQSSFTNKITNVGLF